MTETIPMNPAQSLPAFSTVKDLAKLLGCTPAHAYQIVERNGLAAPLAGTRLIRIPRDRLVAWLSGQR